MATTRKTGDERIQARRDRMVKLRDEITEINKSEKQKSQNQFKHKNLSSKLRSQRTNRLIQKGALSEKYFQHKGGSVENYKQFLDVIVKIPEVKDAINIYKAETDDYDLEYYHTEINDKKSEEIKTATDDNINNIIDLPKNEEYNNTLNLNEISQAENDILAELNKHLQN